MTLKKIIIHNRGLSGSWIVEGWKICEKKWMFKAEETDFHRANRCKSCSLSKKDGMWVFTSLLG